MAKGAPIAIDFGNTNTSVAVWKNGKAEIVANDFGSRTTPSITAFTDAEVLLGEAAYNQQHDNESNTVSNIRSLLGRKFESKEVQELKKKVEYSISKANDGSVKTDVTLQGKKKTYTMEELSTILLGRMRDMAGHFLHETVSQAVLSVPANMDQPEREALIRSAASANIRVVDLILEPVAALMAYNLDVDVRAEMKLAVVVDFGGSRLDVSLLSIHKGLISLIDTLSDYNIGGEQIDKQFVEELCNQFARKHKGLDVKTDAHAMARLKTVSEKSKRALSRSAQTPVEVDTLFAGKDLSLTISKARFELVCGDMLRGVMTPVRALLRKNGLNTSAISDLVLAGGSCRIPKVKQILRDSFPSSTVHDSIPSDEVVAVGASVQASVLAGIPSSFWPIPPSDPQPLKPIESPTLAKSVSVGVSGGVSVAVLPKGTPLPANITLSLPLPPWNRGKPVQIRLVEGESAWSNKNKLVATLSLPAQAQQVSLKVAVGSDGILSSSLFPAGSPAPSTPQVVTAAGADTDDSNAIAAPEFDVRSWYAAVAALYNLSAGLEGSGFTGSKATLKWLQQEVTQAEKNADKPDFFNKQTTLFQEKLSQTEAAGDKEEEEEEKDEEEDASNDPPEKMDDDEEEDEDDDDGPHDLD